MKCIVLLFLVVVLTISNITLVLSQRYNTLARPRTLLSTKYVPMIVSKTCLLKPDEGPCRGNIPMYYFNPSNKECVKFYWGGCQGNGNRFDSKSACEDYCLTKPNEKNTEITLTEHTVTVLDKRPRFCSLTFDYGFCFGAVKRWYFDKLWSVCKERIYSGCGGNKNNFYSFEQCDSICRLAKGSINELSPIKKDGNLKVVYVYTNVTAASRWTTPLSMRSTYTSPSPRVYTLDDN